MLLFCQLVYSESELWREDLDSWLDEGMDLETLQRISEELKEIDLSTPAQSTPDIDFTHIKRVHEETARYRQTSILASPRELEFRRRETLPPFRAVLRNGSVITRLEDREQFEVNQRLFVRAQEQFPGSQFSVLLAPNGEALFIARNIDLTSIEEVTRLLPDVDASVTYQAPTRAHTTDTSFRMENNFSLHQEMLSAETIALLHDSDSKSGNLQRFQYQATTKTGYPFNFGLSFSFAAGTLGGRESAGSISVQGLSFGPVLKWSLRHTDISYWEITLKGERSFSLVSQDDFRTNRLDSVLGAVGLEWTRETFLGPLFLGGEYRLNYLSLKSTDDPELRIDPVKRNFTSLGLLVGYRWRVEL
jgi:hypothetical protein